MTSSPNEPYTNASWYLIHCQPRKEKYAYDAINVFLNLFVYIPEYKQKYHGSTKHFPLFPGYIFVQADLQKVPLSQINASPGVLRLVTFGEDPQPIPHHVIEEIAERSKHIDTFKNEPLRPGDVVRVKHGGPLQDLEMIFVGSMTGSRRVRVLLSFLGRLKQVHLDEETLEKVPSRTANSTNDVYNRRERYTRGKGRKVKHSV
jgi:transcriptional antiterminator RfaH